MISQVKNRKNQLADQFWDEAAARFATSKAKLRKALREQNMSGIYADSEASAPTASTSNNPNYPGT